MGRKILKYNIYIHIFHFQIQNKNIDFFKSISNNNFTQVYKNTVYANGYPSDFIQHQHLPNQLNSQTHKSAEVHAEHTSNPLPL